MFYFRLLLALGQTVSQRILWNHVYVVIFEILNNHAEIIQAPLFRDEMQVNVSGFLPQEVALPAWWRLNDPRETMKRILSLLSTSCLLLWYNCAAQAWSSEERPSCQAVDGVYFELPVDHAAQVSPASAALSLYYRAILPEGSHPKDEPSLVAHLVKSLTQEVADEIVVSLFADCRRNDMDNYETHGVDLQRVEVHVRPPIDYGNLTFMADIVVFGAKGVAPSEVHLGKG